MVRDERRSASSATSTDDHRKCPMTAATHKYISSGLQMAWAFKWEEENGERERVIRKGTYYYLIGYLRLLVIGSVDPVYLY